MTESSTYTAAGVNIDEAGRALRAALPKIQSTYLEPVLAGVGGFGALFRAGFPGMLNPVLVASIDGVGTKTKVAAMVGKFEGLGHDIVNHCVNDILCQGAKPLFFLDYFGAGKLDGLVFEEVLNGASEACRNVGMSLIGGETAEMPGVFHDHEFDVVGSITGVVEAEQRLPREKARVGDRVIALASSGLHTNGFSLARRVLFEVNGLSVRDTLDGLDDTIGNTLLEPHKCYYNAVYPMLGADTPIRALAHITGGGLYDNIPRALSSDVAIAIDRGSWQVPIIFRHIQELGQVADPEMYRAFNMGIGLIMIVDRDSTQHVLSVLEERGQVATTVGEVIAGSREVRIL